MTVVTETQTDGTAIRPFTFEAAEADLEELRTRIAATRWPEKEPVATPRSWTQQAYPNLIYYNKVDRGGHFAAWEQPELFAEEVRAGFRSLR